MARQPECPKFDGWVEDEPEIDRPFFSRIPAVGTGGSCGGPFVAFCRAGRLDSFGNHMHLALRLAPQWWRTGGFTTDPQEVSLGPETFWHYHTDNQK